MLFCHQPTFQSCAFNEVDVVQTKNTTQSFTKQEQLLMLFSMHFCTKDLQKILLLVALFAVFDWRQKPGGSSKGIFSLL